MLGHDPWTIAFAVGLLLYVGLRHHHEGRVRRAVAGSTSPVRAFAGVEGLLLGIVMTGCLLLPVLFLLTPWLQPPWLQRFDDAALGFSRPAAVPATGLVLLVLSLRLFHRSHADLGRQWSITLEIRDQHRLVREGVYRRVRHPMYAAVWGFALAQALILPNLLAGLAGPLSFAPLYLVRTPREEALMRRWFGEEYERYCAETGRLLPRRRRRGAGGRG